MLYRYFCTRFIINNVIGKQIFYRVYSKSSEHVILNEHTVTGRLLLYLNKNCASLEEPHGTQEPNLYLLKKDLYKLHKLDSKTLLNNLNAQDLDKKDLSNLDLELCLRLKQLDLKDVLKALTIYMEIAPNYITQYPFYQHAINLLHSNLDKLDKESFLQFIFFVGLMKKTPKSCTILRHCLRFMDSDFINNLKTEELCIICNSTFKTSTKISNKLFLDKVKDHLNDNLYLLKDPALFVTLIKTVRQNRCQDDNLMSTISCAVLFNKTIGYYNFPVMCHILALFCDYNYYNDVLCEVFTEKCLSILKSNQNFAQDADKPRVKDIKRLLWCLSCFNYKKLGADNLRDVLIPKLLEVIEDFKEEQESLAEIMLYLWMLDYRAQELIPYIFNKNLSKILESKTKSKERLNLLLHCIYFEDRALFKKLNQSLAGNPTYPIAKQLKQRPLLEKVFTTLKNMHQSDVNRFELTCEIPYLNIVGITGYRKNIYKAVYIEVLDEYTCLKNTKGVNGLMALKLRILDGLEEAVIVVSEDELIDSDSSQLEEYLRDEIHLLC